MLLTLLLCSKHPEDLYIARQVAIANSLILHEVTTPAEALHHLKRFPDTIVFWDAEDPKHHREFVQIFPKRVPPTRAFAITKKPLAQYPHLVKDLSFSHHLQRRYPDPAGDIFANLAEAFFNSTPSRLNAYFSKKQLKSLQTQINSISITTTSHKRAAIEALQSMLTQHGLQVRLASLIVQSLDELILDSVLDRVMLVDSRFELEKNETVIVEYIAVEKYIAICVTDRAGVLERAKFIGKEEGRVGLASLLQSGVSVAAVVRPGRSSQATLFIPIVKNFKNFRTAFRFFSYINVT